MTARYSLPGSSTSSGPLNSVVRSSVRSSTVQPSRETVPAGAFSSWANTMFLRASSSPPPSTAAARSGGVITFFMKSAPLMSASVCLHGSGSATCASERRVDARVGRSGSGNERVRALVALTQQLVAVKRHPGFQPRALPFQFGEPVLVDPHAVRGEGDELFVRSEQETDREEAAAVTHERTQVSEPLTPE